MKHFLYIVLLLFVQCNKAGTFHLTGNIGEDVEAMVREGTYDVAVMDSLIESPRQRDLELQIKESIRENYTWYTHYLDSFSSQDPLPYHSNFGISEPEYQELIKLRKDIHLVASSVEKITISKQDHIIHFKAGGKLNILEKLKVDTRNNTIQAGNYILNFSDTIHVTNENHGLKTTWDGYTWRFSDPENMDMNAIRNIDNLTAKHYKVTIGHLNKTGKTILAFTEREMVNGETMTDIDLPIVF